MNPPLSPRRVDTLLSLIVISWGFWLLTWRLYIYLPMLSSLMDGLHIGGRPLCGLLLIVFFPVIVDQIGYWATKERQRGKRIWSFQHLAAIPFVLYAIHLLIDTVVVISLVVFRSFYCIGQDAYFSFGDFLGSLLFAILLQICFAAFFLLLARPMAAWLTRRASRITPIFEKESS